MYFFQLKTNTNTRLHRRKPVRTSSTTKAPLLCRGGYGCSGIRKESANENVASPSPICSCHRWLLPIRNVERLVDIRLGERDSEWVFGWLLFSTSRRRHGRLRSTTILRHVGNNLETLAMAF
ncbi:unnamed protein product [Ectocarpus fasciculatus]